MRCFKFRLNRLLSKCIMLQGIVFAENKKKAKQAIIESNARYIKEYKLPTSMFILESIDKTEPQVLNFEVMD